MIRIAKHKDIEKIYRLGIITKDFRVSKKIKFYEKSEIKRWIGDKKNNILIVVESNSKIIGFVYCKIMSHHWAMVDNFFIIPQHRKKSIGSQIEKFLERELRKRKINYLTCLVKPSNKLSRKFLKAHGFKEQDRYIWIDKFI